VTASRITNRHTRIGALAGAVTGALTLSALLAPTGAVAAGPPIAQTGPSTTVKPYVLPVADGVAITSRWTVGDKPAGNGYRMVGIPDGLGAYDMGDGNLGVLMNHELRENQGIPRAHGSKGAFVAKLTVDRATGAVVEGEDFIKNVRYWQYAPAAGQYGDTPVAPTGAGAGHTLELRRFCSASLTDPGQLLNETTGRGYDGQVFFGNEETGDEGRAFGVTMDGVAHQLPRLGLFSWENTVAAPNQGDTTLVMGNEDAADGQLWAYVGDKQAGGDAIAKAGLTNGANFVFDAVDETVTNDAQWRATYGKGTPGRVDLAEVDWNQSGLAQNVEGKADGLSLNRIEDGAFDPRSPDDYYFLTTEGGGTAENPALPGVTRDGGGLWRLRFADVDRPELGATLELLLDGSEKPYLSKPDNMEIDEHGNLLIQEDPGSNAAIARILAYRIDDGARGVVAQFDPARFSGAADADFLTIDEESSGILDISRLVGKKGTFAFDAQVHKANPDPELVEEGQLLSMTIQAWGQVYTIKG